MIVFVACYACHLPGIFFLIVMHTGVSVCTHALHTCKRTHQHTHTHTHTRARAHTLLSKTMLKFEPMCVCVFLVTLTGRGVGMLKSSPGKSCQHIRLQFGQASSGALAFMLVVRRRLHAFDFRAQWKASKRNNFAKCIWPYGRFSLKCSSGSEHNSK